MDMRKNAHKVQQPLVGRPYPAGEAKFSIFKEE